MQILENANFCSTALDCGTIIQEMSKYSFYDRIVPKVVLNLMRVNYVNRALYLNYLSFYENYLKKDIQNFQLELSEIFLLQNSIKYKQYGYYAEQNILHS